LRLSPCLVNLNATIAPGKAPVAGAIPRCSTHPQEVAHWRKKRCCRFPATPRFRRLIFAGYGEGILAISSTLRTLPYDKVP
jgi:hypothetical protein